MSVQQEITEILQKEFSPTFLEVVNQSHLHQGHAGDDGSGETHFRIEMSAEVFKKFTRLECHRMVYNSLNLLIKNKIHALELDIKRQT